MTIIKSTHPLVSLNKVDSRLAVKLLVTDPMPNKVEVVTWRPLALSAIP